MQKAKAIAYGQVQGVGFRAFCKSLAKKYNISGYAKNLEDGTVEIYAEGQRSLLDEFFKKIKEKQGLIRVTNLKIEYENINQKLYNDFFIY
jgi:acylphosphatase